ncbi:unnamed protein product, partial [Allacma fusca]
MRASKIINFIAYVVVVASMAMVAVASPA